MKMRCDRNACTLCRARWPQLLAAPEGDEPPRYSSTPPPLVELPAFTLRFNCCHFLGVEEHACNCRMCTLPCDGQGYSCCSRRWVSAMFPLVELRACFNVSDHTTVLLFSPLYF